MLAEYIYLQPGSRNGRPDIFKIHSDDKGRWIGFMGRHHLRSETCKVWRTENVNSLKLAAYEFPPDLSKGVRTENLTDEFNEEYGPFELVDEIDLGSVYFKESAAESTSPIYFRSGAAASVSDQDDEFTRKKKAQYGEHFVSCEKTATGHRLIVS